MKIIYVCSPLRGEVKENISFAKEYCKFIAGNKDVPLASHLLLDGVFDDEIAEERNAALKMGLALLECCDELWFFTKEHTEGMIGEMEFAKASHIPIVDMSWKGEKIRERGCGM